MITDAARLALRIRGTVNSSMKRVKALPACIKRLFSASSALCMRRRSRAACILLNRNCCNDLKASAARPFFMYQRGPVLSRVSQI